MIEQVFHIIATGVGLASVSGLIIVTSGYVVGLLKSKPVKRPKNNIHNGTIVQLRMKEGSGRWHSIRNRSVTLAPEYTEPNDSYTEMMAHFAAQPVITMTGTFNTEE